MLRREALKAMLAAPLVRPVETKQKPKPIVFGEPYSEENLSIDSIRSMVTATLGECDIYGPDELWPCGKLTVRCVRDYCHIVAFLLERVPDDG